MTLAHDVLSLLEAEGPLSDAEIAKHLAVRHQQVNQTCRVLADQKLIIREQGAGSIVNRLHGQPTPPAPPPPPIASAGLLSEDEIKRAVKEHLEADGYEVVVMWGRTRGIDIEAQRGRERLIIEAKGEHVSQQVQPNYFLGAPR